MHKCAKLNLKCRSTYFNNVVTGAAFYSQELFYVRMFMLITNDCNFLLLCSINVFLVYYLNFHNVFCTFKLFGDIKSEKFKGKT